MGQPLHAVRHHCPPPPQLLRNATVALVIGLMVRLAGPGNAAEAPAHAPGKTTPAPNGEVAVAQDQRGLAMKKANETKLNLVVNEQPVGVVLDLIAKAGGVVIEHHDLPETTLSLAMTDLSVLGAISMVIQAADLQLTITPDGTFKVTKATAPQTTPAKPTPTPERKPEAPPK